MKIDNFEYLSKFIDSYTSNPDVFFHVQILVRSKDNTPISSGVHVIKQYLILPHFKTHNLQSYKEEIVSLCNATGTRAYINLNPKSLRQLTDRTVCSLADRNLQRSYIGVQNDLFSCAGKLKAISKEDTVWVVDIDSPAFDAVVEIIAMLQDINDASIIGIVKTPNGWHILTRPFDRTAIHEYYPEIDIHTNNPTLLYHNNHDTI